MPQELHVVSCYKCHMFQVDIVKKVTKWTCKMCGEKQSLIKVYAKGSGRECREIAQNLNKQRITLNENLSYKSDGESESNDNISVASGCSGSKWTEFMSADEKSSDNNHDFDVNSNNGRHVSKIDTFNSRISGSDRNKWSDFLGDDTKSNTNISDYNTTNNNVRKFRCDENDYNTDVPYKKQKLCKEYVKSVEKTDYKDNMPTQRRYPGTESKWSVFLGPKPCAGSEKENKNTLAGINSLNFEDSKGRSSPVSNIFADNDDDLDSMLDI